MVESQNRSAFSNGIWNAAFFAAVALVLDWMGWSHELPLPRVVATMTGIERAMWVGLFGFAVGIVTQTRANRLTRTRARQQAAEADERRQREEAARAEREERAAQAAREAEEKARHELERRRQAVESWSIDKLKWEIESVRREIDNAQREYDVKWTEYNRTMDQIAYDQAQWVAGGGSPSSKDYPDAGAANQYWEASVFGPLRRRQGELEERHDLLQSVLEKKWR